MKLTTAQKLGLAPLTGEQLKEQVQNKIDTLVSNNLLPRFAYLDSEFDEYREELIRLLKEQRAIL